MVLGSFILSLSLVLLAIYAYLIHWLGQPSVHAGARLFWRGCIKAKRIHMRAMTVKDVTLLARNSPTAEIIFHAMSVACHSFSLFNITIKITSPHLNFLADSDGLLHVVALLQDVGYLEEAQASPLRLPAAPRGSIDSEASLSPPLQPHRATLSAEVHASIAHMILEDGTVDLPYDVGQIMGKSMEARLAAGTTCVRRESEKREQETEAWWERRSKEVSTSYNRIRYPLLLSLDSENIKTSVKGWRTDTGFLLHEPIETLLHFTPEIAQFTLSKLHPLLGYAVNLEGTDYIRSTLTPLEMHLPSEMMSLRMEPLRVQLKTKAFVKSLISLMKIVGRRDWEEPHTLEAWTSAVAADVYRSGIVVSKRMDIILGHNVKEGKGFHICMWGTVDTAKENAVDMKMGLPASTLRRLGAKEIEDDFTYQIEVGGTAQAPEVNFLRAAKDLAELVLKSNIQEGMPFLKRVMRNPSQKRRIKQKADIPPPSLPFPWEAFSEAEIESGAKELKFETASNS